jgi:hypothetical protein
MKHQHADILISLRVPSQAWRSCGTARQGTGGYLFCITGTSPSGAYGVQTVQTVQTFRVAVSKSVALLLLATQCDTRNCLSSHMKEQRHVIDKRPILGLRSNAASSLQSKLSRFRWTDSDE